VGCGEAERVHAGINRCDSLEDLLASCDVVSLNCDLNADNHHLLNTATLSHIPKNKGVRPHTRPHTHTHHRTHHRNLTVAHAVVFGEYGEGRSDRGDGSSRGDEGWQDWRRRA
jgi:hypothetical protein